MSFTTIAEYAEYIGKLYLDSLNKIHSLNHMVLVIEFYDTNNIISETPEVWNHYSANWKVLIPNEISRHQKYMGELKKIGDLNSQVKEKIKEIERLGPQKPMLYVAQCEFYDNLSINELKEKKIEISNLSRDAIYNYDYETYIKYDTECLYISKVLDQHFFHILLQKYINESSPIPF